MVIMGVLCDMSAWSNACPSICTKEVITKNVNKIATGVSSGGKKHHCQSMIIIRGFPFVRMLHRRKYGYVYSYYGPYNL